MPFLWPQLLTKNCGITARSCSKIVRHPRKCLKVTFVDIFIDNVDYAFIFYQQIHFLKWNSMRKEIFKNEFGVRRSKVHRLNKITTSCLWGPPSTFYRVCILIFQIFQNIITNTPNYYLSEKWARFLDRNSSFGG